MLKIILTKIFPLALSTLLLSACSHELRPTPTTIKVADKAITINADTDVDTDVDTDTVRVLNYILQTTNEKKRLWLTRPSKIMPVKLHKPIKPFYAKPSVVLFKEEFETTKNYKQRILTEQTKNNKQKTKLNLQYQAEIAEYNSAVRAYQTNLNEEVKKRAAKIKILYFDYLNENINKFLGQPILTWDKYNADSGYLFATLVSPKSDFKQPVVVKLPLKLAEDFKRNIAYAKPAIQFKVNTEQTLLFASSVNITLKDKDYPTTLVQK